MSYPHAIRKRSVMINGRTTSVSLEDGFSAALRDIAKENRDTVRNLIAKIDKSRTKQNLSSAIRVFVLGYYRERAEKAVRPRAGRLRVNPSAASAPNATMVSPR